MKKSLFKKNLIALVALNRTLNGNSVVLEYPKQPNFHATPTESIGEQTKILFDFTNDISNIENLLLSNNTNVCAYEEFTKE